MVKQSFENVKEIINDFVYGNEFDKYLTYIGKTDWSYNTILNA